MQRRALFCLLAVVVGGARIEAQETVHGAASNGNARCCRRDNIEPGGKKAGKFYEAEVGVFRGRVKRLNKKEIVIENDSKQMVSIRRSRQTRFLKNNRAIRSSDIDLETPVTVDAREAGTVNLVAIQVTVDSSPTNEC